MGLFIKVLEVMHDKDTALCLTPQVNTLYARCMQATGVNRQAVFVCGCCCTRRGLFHKHMLYSC